MVFIEQWEELNAGVNKGLAVQSKEKYEPMLNKQIGILMTGKYL